LIAGLVPKHYGLDEEQATGSSWTDIWKALGAAGASRDE
jgi:hypothetical protein